MFDDDSVRLLDAVTGQQIRSAFHTYAYIGARMYTVMGAYIHTWVFDDDSVSRSGQHPIHTYAHTHIHACILTVWLIALYVFTVQDIYVYAV